MAKFIKLHETYPNRQEVYTNAEFIQSIYPAILGASIWMHAPKVCTDMYDHEIIRTELQIVCVEETAEEILALLN